MRAVKANHAMKQIKAKEANHVMEQTEAKKAAKMNGRELGTLYLLMIPSGRGRTGCIESGTVSMKGRFALLVFKRTPTFSRMGCGTMGAIASSWESMNFSMCALAVSGRPLWALARSLRVLDVSFWVSMLIEMCCCRLAAHVLSFSSWI